VILDADLAEIYTVPVKQLNQQVKRNQERFPSDFMFQLSAKEHKTLRSQFVTSNISRGGRRYRPYAFTEHGAVMAATVLNSKRAVRMSVLVVRAFVHSPESTAQHVGLPASRSQTGSYFPREKLATQRKATPETSFWLGGESVLNATGRDIAAAA
jgi:hypothetical protein